jgi:ribosomal protein S6
MNNYELTLVLDGKSGAAKKKKVTETKDWGVRDLAYKIGKSTTGLYVYFDLELDPAGAKALNEKLRTDADVLRFLVINKEK